MIQEYRKASAEALRLTGVFFNASTNMFYCDKRQHNIKGEKDPNDSMYIIWQPNTDANQMLMVIDLLLKKDKMIVRNIVLSYVNRGTSLFIATMKAFMEWQRKEEG